MSSPVIFGQDVQLKCEFPSHIKCSSYTRSWTGGPRYALMTMNGISSNNTKYQETKFENCTYSVLTIKSFDQTDVDIVYKCTYGFSSYEHVLELLSLFVLFLLAIVLSVLLRFTDSDYPFGIFKLLLSHNVASSTPE
jgi:hypothetical protein